MKRTMDRQQEWVYHILYKEVIEDVDFSAAATLRASYGILKEPGHSSRVRARDTRADPAIIF